jgi:hypothetical protein
MLKVLIMNNFMLKGLKIKGLMMKKMHNAFIIP